MDKINVLIVDDKEENIIALEALIQRDDINIISTTSPNEALKLAWDQNICLALVDVQMPNIDGFTLVEMLKSHPRTKDILILFVTAISKETKYAVKGLSTGAMDYLYKPLDPIITMAKVDSFIRLAKAQLEIKHKNAALERYAVIIANSVDIICVVDERTKLIEELNPSIEKILGFKKEDVLERPIYSLVPKNRLEDFREELLKLDHEKERTFEFQLLNNKGELVWTECRVTFSKKKYFFSISNHTLQKQYEEQLIHSKEDAIQARNVKETFLANMSHELRTPLNGIIGIANLLKQTELEEAQKQMVKLLEVSSQSLLGVVNDILDLSKIDAGKFVLSKKEVNIYHILKSSIELMRTKANEKLLDLNLEIDPRLPKYIETDPLRLNQILMNLISNAIKFTEKGYVSLRVNQLSHEGDYITVKFEVKDTGIGIQPERKAKIFESYEQADDDTSLKYGGTGLGLGIVKKLVELQNGKIDFNSEYGKGSNFWFELTFRAINNYSTPAENIEELTSFAGMRALVAEDNQINQFIVVKFLKNWNIEVDVTQNGQEAIAMLKKHSYDFILMDTYMPGMGGYEATKHIRTEFNDDKKYTPIISMSAAVLEDEKNAAMEAGMDYVLTKPFIPQDLHRLIHVISLKNNVKL
ncbi:PAS/PAC sensor hybrid histidine kinase [Pseudopedobacter saltans DSM 12145]|uniref:Sensory/regulatory protein RpfC n=1 Tax=Pseudopedobacter saltans (strain ATCC 51119 / DSM 12145 / JCM 21818 / CCUG 39354 / LMG 10337 / NBRC 100064 / NCIMB 13643) TaxID=762903 RepID=F0S7K0_PSESL|nr:response regulator [Pseudopedobacter saltans]ADY52260.1 PAS/PAC sensor hybrid histidine kinase [Pseudopedobacter saltans DSM 12145]